jgi:NADPH-dependent 2,4-dienoyl-CoA reductase/sulfur reductase-like enzyme
MKTEKVDVAVVGGGPAGIAAALSAQKSGAKRVVILERDEMLGGILNQCIHEGFGLEIFKEALTGPEYMQRYIDEVENSKLKVMLNSMVIDITKEREVLVSSPKGLLKLDAKSVVLCMGCRERTRGALRIPGSRPAGIFTAGVAQNFMNLQNYMIGKRIVILGSGDIGLIMARRLTLEGAKVLAVLEILPYPGGLMRNVVQCLNDFDIPLLQNHTVIDIQGKDRVESVMIAEVDENWNPIEGTESKIECDTLLLSIGLIPENELSKKAGVALDSVTGGPVVDDNLMTNVKGIFACGNVLHVHDIVDYVTIEAEKAGRNAAEFAEKGEVKKKRIEVKAGEGIQYVLPKKTCPSYDTELFLRVEEPGQNKKLIVSSGKKILKKVKKKVVVPSEMIRLKLKKSDLEGIKHPKVLEVRLADNE